MKFLLLFISLFITSTAYANNICHHVVILDCQTDRGASYDGPVRFIGLLNVKGHETGFEYQDYFECESSTSVKLDFKAFLDTTNEVHNWCNLRSVRVTGSSFGGTQNHKEAKTLYRKYLGQCMKNDTYLKCFSYKDLEL